MKKTELIERVKEIERKRIAEGYLKGSLVGYFRIKNKSIKMILEFARVMLKATEEEIFNINL